MAQVIPLRGGWYSDFRFRGRRIRRFLSKNQREAQVELGRLISRVRTGAGLSGTKDTTWKPFRDRYLEYSAGSKAPETRIRDASAINALECTFPIVDLKQLTPELLEMWKAKRLQAGKGKATVNRDLTAVKALLRKAVAWGYIEQQDWTSVKELRTARGRLLFYSPEELSGLLARCHGVWETICRLGAQAGLRRSEMYWLGWEAVSFERNHIHIAPIGGWVPKDYEQRVIPLAKPLLAHLRDRQGGSSWVLAERDGSRPKPSVMSAYFGKLCRKSGLRGGLHTLRHTFASHLVQGGASLKVVKDLLGHSSMATTEIYAHLTPRTYEDAIGRLPDV